MSIITIIKRRLRRTRIAMLQEDLDWARASSYAHITGLEQKLYELRQEAIRDMTADDVARTVTRRARGAI